MRTRGLALAVLLALGCAACQNPTPTATGVPASATSSAEPAAPTAEEFEAIRFRTENSLQADLAHVRAVAADPNAKREFGVPLLPEEFDELMSRSANAEDIIAIVQAEAAKAPNDYCGIYLDNANQGAVTSLWKSNGLLHEIAIRTQVRPDARIAFRDCRFSEPEQEAAMEALRAADGAWIRDIPAAMRGYGFDTSNNVLQMEISSAVPNAADLVRQGFEQRLGLVPGMLVVHSDGTGAALRPRGNVLITVLGPNGKPVGENNLGLNWTSLDLPGLECGSGTGYGVPADGSPVKLPCQQGTWEIQVFGEGIDDVLGRGTVQVDGGKTTKLTIRLTRNPGSNPG